MLTTVRFLCTCTVMDDAKSLAWFTYSGKTIDFDCHLKVGACAYFST